MGESKKNLNLTRRNFMAMGSAAIAAPFVMKMTGSVPNAEAAAKKAEKKSIKSITPFRDVETLYPGVYTKKEKSLLPEYDALAEAIDKRGPVDVEALVSGKLPKDTPGIGTKIKVTEAWVRYNNEKYDPENPILNNASYAKKLGYKDILAYPPFGIHDDSIHRYEHPGKDTISVSDLNYEIKNYKPVYPGDTLFLVINKWTYRDITPPEGSIYRSVAVRHEGSVYNHKGEKVNDVIFRLVENGKIYKEGKKPEKPIMGLDHPDWNRRPAHYYTDEDWEFIKDIWANEKRQGATPLYWEDVNIGDEPTWTLDGPIEESIMPVPPWGMGSGGSRASIKKEIMDPKIFPTLVRSKKDGIYRLPNRKDQVPPIPEYNEPITAAKGSITGKSVNINTAIADDMQKNDAAPTVDEKADNRTILINYMGRDIAIRHINNWMGDKGWLCRIHWSIMKSWQHAAYGKPGFPINPEAEQALANIPIMKGRYMNAHGLTTDVAIVKSYVLDKYVRDSEYFVELGWWIENIEGYIWEEGSATVRLPSKNV